MRSVLSLKSLIKYLPTLPLVYVWLTLLTVLTSSFVNAEAADKPASDNVYVVLKKTCEAINDAIQGLPPAGGTVVLTEGDYYCGTPILIPRSSVRLLGAGANKTLIRVESGKSFPVLFVGHYPSKGNEIRAVELAGFSIAGDFPGVTLDPERECYNPVMKQATVCKSAPDASESLLHNNGLTLLHVRAVYIHDVRADHNFAAGLSIGRQSTEVKIEGFSATKNARDGIVGSETTLSSFSDLDLDANLESGANLSHQFSTNSFFGMNLRGNGASGLRVDAACKQIHLINAYIKTGNPNVECLSLGRGAQLQRSGSYNCEQF